MCHCVQGYCNNNFFVLTCIFLQFYYYFHFFCHTSMLFSSAYTCDLFYCLHFEYMYTVEQCFVRYLCYRTPYFLYLFPVLRPCATSFATITRLVCSKICVSIFYRHLITLNVSFILCSIMTQKRKIGLYLFGVFFNSFSFIDISILQLHGSTMQ